MAMSTEELAVGALSERDRQFMARAVLLGWVFELNGDAYPFWSASHTGFASVGHTTLYRLLDDVRREQETRAAMRGETIGLSS